MAPWTFHIVTFGCKVNQYESQALREAWTAQGGQECDDPAAARVAVVNSCAVTARGERDARNALYRLHRAAPEARRILTGCSACLAGKNLQDPSCLDVLVPPRAKALLLQGPWTPALGGSGGTMTQGGNTEGTLSPDIVVSPFGEGGFSIRAFRRARPVLKVQDGCSHRCTYCIVPLVRGPALSRPLPDILQEAEGLLEAGHGEIMISGINLHQYGRDTRAGQGRQGREAGDFWSLLQTVDARLAPRWAGRARLRISSLEPSQLTSRGLDILGNCRMVCPHAHLSLQHGSPAVLKRMGRGHCRPLRLVQAAAKLRQLWPVMGLGADVLMGFPGETQEDVRLTLDIVRELGLTYAHVFPYSARPGTPAAHFGGQIPHQEKLARAATVRTAVAEQQKDFWRDLLTLPELTVALDASHAIDETMQGKGTVKGVDAHYAPCRLACTPAPHTVKSGMVRARPLRAGREGLVVQPLP